MQGRRNPFVAQEGIPFLVLAVIACVLSFQFLDYRWLAASILLLFVLVLVFRDPRRRIPASPLGVVSPADGKIVEVELADNDDPAVDTHRILIRINSFGTYSARCPVEGKIMNLDSNAAEIRGDYQTNALWVQTDEGEDVVLQFRGYRFGLPPKSFIRFGERLGQGSRCAYLRLVRFAEVYLPADSRVTVAPGQKIVAGEDLLATLPPP